VKRRLGKRIVSTSHSEWVEVLPKGVVFASATMKRKGRGTGRLGNRCIANFWGGTWKNIRVLQGVAKNSRRKARSPHPTELKKRGGGLGTKVDRFAEYPRGGKGRSLSKFGRKGMGGRWEYQCRDNGRKEGSNKLAVCSKVLRGGAGGKGSSPIQSLQNRKGGGGI